MEKAKGSSISRMPTISTANQKMDGMVLKAKFEGLDDRNLWEVEVGTDDGSMLKVKLDVNSGAGLSSG